MPGVFNVESYHLNPYFIPPTIVAFLVIVVGFFIYSLEKKSSFNRSFLYLCLSAAVWLFGNVLVLLSRSEIAAGFWARFLYMGLILIPVTVFHITVTYTNRYLQEKPFVISAYGAALVFMILTWQSNSFSGMRECFFGYYPDAGWLKSVFLFLILFFSGLGLQNLINYYRNSKDLNEKKRTKHLTIAFIFATLSYVDILASYGIGIYPFGYLAVLCFILILTYSVIKYHNLMVMRYSQELEKDVEKKTSEINHIIGELRATQLKLLETGKVSALASLSAGILHQISQPITAIHGFVRFIKKEMSETDRFYKAIALMEEQSVYLKDMLEDLMELIRHREVRKENVDINFCIKRATNLLTDELRIRRINWDLDLAQHLPKVYADSVHLQQIFMNIMVNAMEALVALPKGSTRYIKVTTCLDESNQKVVVIFEDTGPGITPDIEKQIFEPFFSTKTKGSGIGLALSKDLLAEHQGEIKIESKEGIGAIFVLKFPCASVIAQSAASAQETK